MTIVLLLAAPLSAAISCVSGQQAGEHDDEGHGRGADKDSEHRQREAVAAYAERAGYRAVGEHYDAAVSGADPVERRPGFAAMLEGIEGDGVRVVVVEDATRFARSLMAQELGVLVMQQRGVQVICSNSDNLTQTDDPSRIMMRQVAGAFAEYEKSRLVQKLRHARDRKSAAIGRRIEGRKGYSSLNPEVVAEARRLRERGMTQREIARALNESGFRTLRGTEIGSGQVCRMLGLAGVPVTSLPQSTSA